MLVEINLLPVRERKKSTFIVLLASVVSLIVIVSSVYLWQGSTMKTQTASVDRELAVTQKVAAINASNTNTSGASASVTQLKNAIKWANDYPIKTIPLMNKLTALLPERGFIKSFAYTEAGTINLTVQFDTESQAAYFLTNLTNEKWIQNASLSSLTTAPLPDASAAANAAANTTVTNQTGTTTASGYGVSTNTTTVNSTATANSTQTTVTGTGSSINTQVQSAQTTANTQPSSTAAASTSTVSGAAQANSNELPRYIGQFAITLNQDVLKREEKGSIQNGEGGTGS